MVEDAWNTALGGVLARRGWQPTVVAYDGYGGPGWVRVLGRAVLTPASDGGVGAAVDDLKRRRGWRNFLTAEAAGTEVLITVGTARHIVRTDRSGLLDVRLPAPGLQPGWCEITLTARDAEPVLGRVFVVEGRETFGIVSDIDDTVITTFLPRPLIAAYTTFVLREEARRPVKGMAALYAGLLRDHPGAPTVYVSTGAWNAAASLTRFLGRHRFPDGPLLLTDWGPTNTGWFRSGQDHKRECLRRLAEDFPRIRWLLIGDDGQHDPSLYTEFAYDRPEHVRAIAIRQLTAGEHVLAHGIPATQYGEKSDDVVHPEHLVHEVPEVRAPDGVALARALADLDLR